MIKSPVPVAPTSAQSRAFADYLDEHMRQSAPIETVKSWCDACQAAFEATGHGCDGHFMCTRPVVPEGYRLTGAKERTPTGWREDVVAADSEPAS